MGLLCSLRAVRAVRAAHLLSSSSLLVYPVVVVLVPHRTDTNNYAASTALQQRVGCMNTNTCSSDSFATPPAVTIHYTTTQYTYQHFTTHGNTLKHNTRTRTRTTGESSRVGRVPVDAVGGVG